MPWFIDFTNGLQESTEVTYLTLGNCFLSIWAGLEISALYFWNQLLQK